MEKIRENKYNILIVIIIVFGILIRSLGVTELPNALNCDEASAGYEAYSILNYGIDRNGKFMPVFLQSWGSGQNSLLSYLMIPFIKVLGLNILSVRLPMVIVSCISLIVMFFLLKRVGDKKLALIGTIFFVICPWHIMKSRWALESNLFPDIMLLAVFLLIYGLNNKNKYIYYLSFAIAGLTAYTYGTSYFFLPLFIIPLLITLIVKKEITIKEAIWSIAILALVALPIILFVIINTFNLGEIRLPFMTIPRLEVNRYKIISSLFSKDFFALGWGNIKEAMKILFFQVDDNIANAIFPSGLIYLFSGFFTIIGIIFSFKKNKKLQIKYDYIFKIWLISSFLLIIVCKPSIPRFNIMMIPIIIYTIFGIYYVLKSSPKYLYIVILAIYILSYMSFIFSYAITDFDKSPTFENDLEEAIKYIDEIPCKEAYVTMRIKEPYIYVLFYTKHNTLDFVNTVEYYNEHIEFRQVKSFGKYIFKSIKTIDTENKNSVYLIKNYDLERYDNLNPENSKITKFEKYTVIEIK